MNIVGFLWGTRAAKMVTVIAGTFAAVLGAITAAHTAWPIVEPAMPVLHFHMRGYVGEKLGEVILKVGGIQATTDELLIWKFEDNRDRAKAETEDKRILLEKEENPKIKAMIQENIESSVRKQQDYTDRIKKLKGQ